MKKLVFISLLFVVGFGSMGQSLVNFDDSASMNYISIDTINYPNNIWQIGPPQKAFFDSAFSFPNAILTDTINTYPTNDTSVFYLWHTVHLLPTWWPTLEFYFKTEADSMNDFGIIEVSPDSGQTWVDIIKEATAYGWEWGILPTGQGNWAPWDTVPFTGTTNGWHWFNITMFTWDNYFGYNDSILFRFTFISDSVETNQEGWMIDDIVMGEMISSVEEISNEIDIKIHPNPTTGKFTVQGTTGEIQVYDLFGRLLLRSNKEQIDMSSYPVGIYMVRAGETTRKLIIQ